MCLKFSTHVPPHVYQDPIFLDLVFPKYQGNYKEITKEHGRETKTYSIWSFYFIMSKFLLPCFSVGFGFKASKARQLSL